MPSIFRPNARLCAHLLVEAIRNGTAHSSPMEFRLFFTLIVAGSLCACGSSGPSPTTPSPGATNTFQGTIAGSGGQSGTLMFTVQARIAAASPSLFKWPFIARLYAQATGAAASGSVRLVGGITTALSGTFDSSTKALSLSGGGFAFAGSLAGIVVSGTYTGPSGVTGGFASLSTTGGTVTAYCGNIFSNASTVVTGVFNLAVSSTGAASGTFQVGSNAGLITGQANGAAFTITYTDRVTGAQGAGSGTIQAGTLSGTSTSGNPFSGSTSACQ